MRALYKFQELDNRMTKWGFPIIDGNRIYPPIIRVPFKRTYNEGKIIFKKDGIYYIDEFGREWKGYMYMPKYRITHYGDFPRFHLLKCKIIEEFIQGGMLNSYYEWSNQKYNDIVDRDTGKIHENQKLKLCNYCRKGIFEKIETTEDFFKTLGKEMPRDIYGYSIEHSKISKQYRESKKYTCEICGIGSQKISHRQFWHTHHIDGNKSNNNLSNLKCLCILCHSQQDNLHEDNFRRVRMYKELNAFIDLYRDEIEKYNPYLKK